MNWFTAMVLMTYVGICEVRAPNASACDGRWAMAIGVLVPSPLSPVMPTLGRLVARRKPEDEQQGPKA
jgi:hypothetical protein